MKKGRPKLILREDLVEYFNSEEGKKEAESIQKNAEEITKAFKKARKIRWELLVKPFNR